MKKSIFVLAALSLALISGPTAQAADKVVVVPLNTKQAVSFETVSKKYTIAGTTFLPLRGVAMAEADGYEVVQSQPYGALFSTGNISYGTGHNLSGYKMTFTAPVHLPQGASLGGIGAAVCSTDDTLTDHNITLELVKTNMQDGTRTAIRSLSITNSNCNTLQATPPNTLYLYETIDNSQYAYEFQVRGIEGGKCTTSGTFPNITWSCDPRRTIIQFASISYRIDEIVRP